MFNLIFPCQYLLSICFLAMYSCGPPHMDVQEWDDQHEHTYSNYVRTQDVTLKTCRRRWMIGRNGERGSRISALAARHDDDDIFSLVLSHIQFSFYLVSTLAFCRVKYPYLVFCLVNISFSFLTLSVSHLPNLTAYWAQFFLLKIPFKIPLRLIYQATPVSTDFRVTFIYLFLLFKRPLCILKLLWLIVFITSISSRLILVICFSKKKAIMPIKIAIIYNIHYINFITFIINTLFFFLFCFVFWFALLKLGCVLYTVKYDSFFFCLVNISFSLFTLSIFHLAFCLVNISFSFMPCQYLIQFFALSISHLVILFCQYFI